MDFKNKKLVLKKIIYYLIGFLPLTVTLFAYPHIPEQIPAHYSTMGEIARWGNKGEVLIIPFLLAIFTYVKPRIFKNKFLTEAENEISSFATLLFMVSVNLLSYLQVFTSINGYILTKFNFYNLSSSIICLIFIFLGYIFSTCNRNDSVSIKIPSYLMKNSVWKNLHHNLGSYWMSIGIVFLPTGILCGNIYILHILISEIIFIIIVPLILTFYYIRKYIKS